MTNPKISVVIVSWNVAASLKACLRSVFATKYPNLEVFVVDNASTDDSTNAASAHKHVQVLKNVTNIGFPRAVNQGLRLSTGDYLLILNPDTEIPPDFFKNAVAFLKKYPQAWLVGPKFTDPIGAPQGSVFMGSDAKSVPSSTIPIPVPAISGACFFMPKSTLEKVGLLTEKVFMYYEDLDYCRRIRAGGGQVFFNPDIVIVHHHGLSAGQTPQTYKYLTESFLYPLRQLLHQPNTLPSTQRYLTESSIWYHGWPKHMATTAILWLHQKLKNQRT